MWQTPRFQVEWRKTELKIIETVDFPYISLVGCFDYHSLERMVIFCGRQENVLSQLALYIRNYYVFWKTAWFKYIRFFIYLFCRQIPCLSYIKLVSCVGINISILQLFKFTVLPLVDSFYEIIWFSDCLKMGASTSRINKGSTSSRLKQDHCENIFII